MYCPRCDMEFREGVTVCTDCGSPLVDKEEWLKSEEERMQAEAADKAAKEEEKEAGIKKLMEMTPEELDALVAEKQAYIKMMQEPSVYVEGKDKYNDNKSSAVAFTIVGFALALFCVFLWTGKIRLGILVNITMTVFAAASIVLAFISNRNADKMKGAISEEEDRRKKILDSFLETYTKEDIDGKIRTDGLGPEETALVRFDIIQDMLMNTDDISDKTFAAAIAEDIYEKLYEKDTVTA